MTEGDRAYYKACLRTELRRAHLATCPKARAAHLSEARAYEQRLAGKRSGNVFADEPEDFRLAA